SSLCLLPLTIVNSVAQEFPFQKGEKLSYLISWSFIPAGRATLEIAHQQDGDPAGAGYHFIMTAHTLPAIALIYPYQERVDSYTTGDLRHSLKYKKMQESRHTRDIVVRFNWTTNTAQYSNFGQTENPISVPAETLDPLSALYYIRSQQLSPPFTVEHPVTDGKKLSLGKAKFLNKESITIRGKTYQTIKIEPDLRDVKGVFEKSPGASMYIWLTDDSRQILVKLKSKVVVGSFIAELIEEDSVLPRDVHPLDKKGDANTGVQPDQPPESMGSNNNAP
ncbi:MAG: DUF3108 domain-containing protein, partial [Desulfobulbaceae bacterium]|nr:DUF3108 domain-containing protein [Desulfobulbaceae bacterium]